MVPGRLPRRGIRKHDVSSPSLPCPRHSPQKACCSPGWSAHHVKAPRVRLLLAFQLFPRSWAIASLVNAALMPFASPPPARTKKPAFPTNHPPSFLRAFWRRTLGHCHPPAPTEEHRECTWYKVRGTPGAWGLRQGPGGPVVASPPPMIGEGPGPGSPHGAAAVSQARYPTAKRKKKGQKKEKEKWAPRVRAPAAS
ncbi:hypothetical protein VUR80DRAFT_1037 [Thermomyces stellatus]